ncbi:unnamed protein product [Phytophthora fragariaefolia]|uniref:Unnamed protein product n=1 Tax=Phytophthora fragariaefolia TaxID=1490495 RepID=A0A9W6X3H7_9STRA|nr:unnamed protein product [Phytophthora fragariaefolia]
MDSSDEENSPPNVPEPSHFDGPKTGTQDTTVALWFSPDRVKKRSESSPPAPAKPAVSPSPLHLRAASPITSSPVLLETPPRASPRPRTDKARHLSRQDDRRARREAAAPYACSRATPKANHSFIESRVAVRIVSDETSRPRTESARSDDVFVPARWPFGVIHLSDHFNPIATVFPAIPHFGLCGCWNPCRTTTCRNVRVNVYCNLNCCPYDGKCGNGLDDSSKVLLGRNVRTRQLGVVAAEDISAGEVLGQYLGEIEHLAVSRAGRSRNGDYRLLLKQRPEKPAYPIRAAINAERMGSLMWLVSHSCKPVAQFIEVTNGRRTTVVVATTQDIRRGLEVTVDYGDDLWFGCRCQLPGCVHCDIQGDQDP